MSRLLDKYNDNVEDIYRRSIKSESPGDEPYYEVRIKDAEEIPSWESRAIPIESTARDLKRMTNFLKSGRGLLFMGKQALLQTGNTFAETRLLNPAFVLEHTVPFIHDRRHWILNEGVLGFFADGESKGKLQTETWESIKPKIQPRLYGRGGLFSRRYVNLPTNRSRAFGFFRDIAESLINIVKSPLQGARGEGQLGDDWETSRPELLFRGDTAASSFVDYVARKAGQLYFSYETDSVETYIPQNLLPQHDPSGIRIRGSKSTAYNEDTIAVTDENTLIPPVKLKNLVRESTRRLYFGTYVDLYNDSKKKFDKSIKDQNEKQFPVFRQQVEKYLNDLSSYKRTGENMSIGIPGINVSPLAGYLRNEDTRTSLGNFEASISHYPKDSQGRIRYYKDITQLSYSIFKDDIRAGYDSDSVDVLFRVKDAEPVRFRAFISDLQESSQPEYTENKYIGRVERYYVYQGVLRNISFKLTLHAFSEDELIHIWEKINYLTSLTHPLDVNGGYIKPNIVKLDIGGIYYKQPVIIMDVNYNFDTGGSWDIDEQLPQNVEVTISARILEKQVHTYENRKLYGTGDFATARINRLTRNVERLSRILDESISDIQINPSITSLVNQ